MSDLFEPPDEAATPLTHEERLQLIPAYIAYRHELNEAEQENIARAQDWALSRRRDLLNEKFIKDLHRRMLGDVWRWAGKFRTSQRNIGLDYWEISVALRFSWGRGSLNEPGAVRHSYIAALQAADHHDIAPLLAFARS